MNNKRLSSEEDKVANACANCGKTDGDEFKLKNCTACFLVKYCSVSCQKSHRKQHKKECRERAAELKDEALFSHGRESCFGDCPICMLSMPLGIFNYCLNVCCMKRICKGCILAVIERGMNDTCPFCREKIFEDPTTNLALVQRRADAGDAEAVSFLGQTYEYGQFGLQEDKSRAVEIYREGANLGAIGAHYNLGCMYFNGEGGLEKDEAMAAYHFEIAAKAGHPDARFNLGNIEGRKRNFDRAMKHHMIAAKMGHEMSLKNIQMLHENGLATKYDYSQALVGYHQAVEETKSDQREKAKASF